MLTVRGLGDALARAADRRGRPTDVWLRDDDAVTVTPALERLGELCGAAAMPVLLAVIPADATADLSTWTAARPLVTPCQHGWAHANHAAAGERACELGGDRSDAIVLGELARGRARLADLFGAGVAPILVPPWNRIGDSLLPLLTEAGFPVLSAYSPAPAPPEGRPVALASNLDIIDWRNDRRGRPADAVFGWLGSLVDDAAGTGAPIGLLTHHLAHDATAWATLAALLDVLAAHPDCRFRDARDLAGLPPS